MTNSGYKVAKDTYGIEKCVYLRWDCTYTCLLVRASEDTMLEFYMLLKMTTVTVLYIAGFFATMVAACGTMSLDSSELQLLAFLGVVVNISNQQVFFRQILG